MRKFLSVIAVMLVVCMVVPTSVSAQQNPSSECIIYLENGDYISAVTSEGTSRSAATKTGSKVYTYHASSGDERWRAVLSGTFTYTGTSATCTASSCSVTIYDSAWYQVSKTTGKSGATATAELVMGRKLLGITISKETFSMSLTCSKDGTLS